MASVIKSDTAFLRYATSGQQTGEGDRLSIGHAAIAMFGLSALGWVLVMGPLLTLLQ